MRKTANILFTEATIKGGKLTDFEQEIKFLKLIYEAAQTCNDLAREDERKENFHNSGKIPNQIPDGLSDLLNSISQMDSLLTSQRAIGQSSVALKTLEKEIDETEMGELISRIHKINEYLESQLKVELTKGRKIATSLLPNSIYYALETLERK